MEPSITRVPGDTAAGLLLNEHIKCCKPAPLCWLHLWSERAARMQTPVLQLLGNVVASVSWGALQPTLCLAFVSSQILDVRNVMVVVSRWYGGILLGPDRFKHINNCARNILVEEGHAPSTVRQAYEESSPQLLLTLSDSWKSETPNISCRLAVLHILHEPQHISSLSLDRSHTTFPHPPVNLPSISAVLADMSVEQAFHC